MAEQNDARTVSLNVGVTAGTVNFPIFKNITGNGCIRILDANIWSGGAGTITANLVYTDPTGATVGGTIATLGSTAQEFAAAGTAALVIAGAVTTPVVPPNKVVAVELADVEAGSDTVVSVTYIKGQ